MLNNFVLIKNQNNLNFCIDKNQQLDFLELANNNDLIIDIDVKKNVNSNINFSSLNYLDVKRKIIINIFINEDLINLTFNINLLGLNKSTTIIEINAYSEQKVNSSIDIEINGIIDSSQANITAIPKFIFNHNCLNAKHGVIIGSVNFKQLLYLMNRGIEQQQAKFLLISSHLFLCLNHLDDYNKEKYKQAILKIWKDNTNAKY